MYKKNDVIQLEISTLGSEGEGIGKIDGFPFFVRGTVPGDVIEAGVTKVKKNMAFARLIKLITPSLTGWNRNVRISENAAAASS